MRNRTAALVLAALALGVGAPGALAQGAGDDQYQDPLAAPSEPAQQEEQEPAPATSAPQPTTGGGSETAGASQTADAPAAAAPSEELPRTGPAAGLVGLAGVALAGAGAALRRRT